MLYTMLTPTAAATEASSSRMRCRVACLPWHSVKSVAVRYLREAGSRSEALFLSHWTSPGWMLLRLRPPAAGGRPACAYSGIYQVSVCNSLLLMPQWNV